MLKLENHYCRALEVTVEHFGPCFKIIAKNTSWRAPTHENRLVFKSVLKVILGTVEGTKKSHQYFIP